MKAEIDRDLFRHRLYELMVEQNLSQYDLAREMRISVSALNNWFHLNHTPSKSSIKKPRLRLSNESGPRINKLRRGLFLLRRHLYEH